LPAGVVEVEGNFAQQEAVRIVVVQRKSRGSFEYEKEDPAPFEVGRALVNYSAAEIKRIRGLKSTEIHGALGYADSEYIALRENIAFGNRTSRPTTPNRMSMSHETEQRH
jgi:glutamate 5-kinase